MSLADRDRRLAEETQMDRTHPADPGRRHDRLRVVPATLLGLLLLSGTALAACSGAHPAVTPRAAVAAMPTMDGQIPTIDATPATVVGGDLPMAGAGETWGARPDYVRSDPATEEAYAFALAHPQIVRWMPCYCGCEAMGHGSNLDCYFKHGQPGDAAVFEEHASFCDICVQITLKTKQMHLAGSSLHEIRLEIDRTFGGSAPGTLTDQPPV